MSERDIVERLLKVEPDEPGERTRWYRNPDGPEAAAEIERLRAELAAAHRVHAAACEAMAAAREAGQEDVLSLLSPSLANDLRRELKGPKP